MQLLSRINAIFVYIISLSIKWSKKAKEIFIFLEILCGKAAFFSKESLKITRFSGRYGDFMVFL